jgi:hypothetical protein
VIEAAIFADDHDYMLDRRRGRSLAGGTLRTRRSSQITQQRNKADTNGELLPDLRQKDTPRHKCLLRRGLQTPNHDAKLARQSFALMNLQK